MLLNTNHGRVVAVGDGIAISQGLTNAMSGELVYFPKSSIKGLVLNLMNDNISVVILGNDRFISQGDLVQRCNSVAKISLNFSLLGSAVDSLCNRLDLTKDEIQKLAGKNKKNQKQVYCIYTAVGQKRSTVMHLLERLRVNGSLYYTVIVAATASESAPLQFLAPYSGCTIGEFFRDQGLAALVIYDDLTKQAVAYRQMSLLLRRPPGREAYPGDVFYLHSRLLE